MQGIQAAGEVPRRVDPEPPRRLHVIARPVPKRPEIHEMVRVELADEDRVERFRTQPGRQTGEGAMAKIERNGTTRRLDEIGRPDGARPIALDLGRTGADDGQAHSR